jgi:hypothetical protein
MKPHEVTAIPRLPPSVCLAQLWKLLTHGCQVIDLLIDQIPHGHWTTMHALSNAVRAWCPPDFGDWAIQSRLAHHQHRHRVLLQMTGQLERWIPRGSDNFSRQPNRDALGEEIPDLRWNTDDAGNYWLLTTDSFFWDEFLTAGSVI